ncbi:MAG TPA: adenylyl-sulfate kinase, partial [Rhodospirillaceae bacterium]|nr:adenylyl-sulfate kinase [Rhodospirillaceae bacterium]
METTGVRMLGQKDKNYKQMRIVIVGHVDHGKSSLIGRLLFDTDSLPPNKQEEIRTMSEKRGMDMEWSFVLDSFQAERDQAITIDTTQIWFSTDKRDYVIIDAPGHREFLKNMISGAAAAEAAILVVDANEGVREQTKRHAYLLHLLGLRQIVVAVNKMDLVNYDEARFKEVSDEVNAYLTSIGLEAKSIVPISARTGDNVAQKTQAMPWYKKGDVIEQLDSFEPLASLSDKPLRFPVQDVYRFDGQRTLVGRIE